MILGVVVEWKPKNSSTHFNHFWRNCIFIVDVTSTSINVKSNTRWTIHFLDSFTFIVNQHVCVWFCLNTCNVSSPWVSTSCGVQPRYWLHCGSDWRTLLSTIFEASFRKFTTTCCLVKLGSLRTTHAITGSIGTNEKLATTRTSIAASTLSCCVNAPIHTRNRAFRHTS